MNIREAEDFWLACLCEATASIDHSRISDRHLSERAAKLYKAVVSLRDEGWAIVTPPVLAHRAEVNIEAIAGIERRIGKIDAEATIRLAEDKLLEAWKRNEMIRLYAKASAKCEERGPEEAAKELQQAMAELAIDGLGDPHWKTPLEWAERYLNDLRSKQEGRIAKDIKSGFPSIDKSASYWKPGRMTVVGARSSNGKTTLTAQVLLGMALRGTPVGIISLEDHPTIITKILLKSLADDVGAITRLEDPDHTIKDIRMVEFIAQKVLRNLPLYIDWIPTANLNRVKRSIKDCVRKFGCRVVMVDYIQCVRGGKADVARRIKIMDAAAAWKASAGTVGAHFILTSQLNLRDDNTRPTKGNLKECSDLEEMAEYVHLIYRPPRTLGSGFKPNEDVDLIVDKCKDGRVGTVKLEWDTTRACFIEPNTKED